MPLKFPYARLFIHNLLADGNVSGAQAIALSACEFGLLDEAPPLVIDSSSLSGNCTCMDAARKVLMKYFDTKATSSLDVDGIWCALEADAQKYASKDPSIEMLGDEPRHDCAKFAPILFDLLLQQIRRYP